MMDASLPNSLKHIISNAEYYGPSLFQLATNVVKLFIFQELSQLSQLQDNGLTDVILFALLKKNVPATREVLGSLPTFCLNTAPPSTTTPSDKINVFIHQHIRYKKKITSAKNKSRWN